MHEVFKKKWSNRLTKSRPRADQEQHNRPYPCLYIPFFFFITFRGYISVCLVLGLGQTHAHPHFTTHTHTYTHTHILHTTHPSPSFWDGGIVKSHMSTRACLYAMYQLYKREASLDEKLGTKQVGSLSPFTHTHCEYVDDSTLDFDVRWTRQNTSAHCKGWGVWPRLAFSPAQILWWYVHSKRVCGV